MKNIKSFSKVHLILTAFKFINAKKIIDFNIFMKIKSAFRIDLV